MEFKRLIAWVIGVLAVAAQAPVWAQLPVPAAAVRCRSWSVAAARPFVGYRRYRGTVGGRAVVVELPLNDDKVESSGRFCYEARPTSYRTLSTPALSQQKLRLREITSRYPARVVARWVAQQPAGPLLTGVRISADGHRVPFKLRENYYDRRGRLQAVPFELVKGAVAKIYLSQEDTTGREARVVLDSLDARAKQDSSWHPSLRLPEDMVMIELKYVHLLTPDTVRQPLLALQCPGPLARRQEAEAELRRLGNHRGIEETEWLQVLYMGYGLLNVETGNSTFFQGAAAFMHSAKTTLYDLRTGRQVTTDDLLRVGTTERLNKLVRRVKQKTPRPPEVFVSLSPGDVSIADSGICFPLPESNGYIENDSEAVLVPWAELRPLLRPGSPVARMLRERGLWRAGKKK